MASRPVIPTLISGCPKGRVGDVTSRIQGRKKIREAGIGPHSSVGRDCWSAVNPDSNHLIRPGLRIRSSRPCCDEALGARPVECSTIQPSVATQTHAGGETVIFAL
jgi:hypothetical protein